MLNQSAIVPKRDWAGMDRPENGIGANVETYLKNYMDGKLQVEGTKNSAGGFNVAVRCVSPMDTGQYHRNGSILFILQRKDSPAQAVFDSSTLMFLTLQQGIDAANFAAETIKNSKTTVEENTNSPDAETRMASYLGKSYRSANGTAITSKTWISMPDFIKSFGVMVRADEPDGYSTKQVGSFTRLDNEPMYSMTFVGRQHIHSSYFDPPFEMNAGTKLYMLIKKVPTSWCSNSAVGDSIARLSEKDKATSKTMAIVVLFYASPNGRRPPLSNAVEMLSPTQVHQQPPLYCRDYKVFDDPKNPKKFRMETGHCIFLGVNLFRVPSINPTPYMARKEVPMRPHSKMVEGGKLDVFLSIKPHFR